MGANMCGLRAGEALSFIVRNTLEYVGKHSIFHTFANECIYCENILVFFFGTFFTLTFLRNFVYKSMILAIL